MKQIGIELNYLFDNIISGESRADLNLVFDDEKVCSNCIKIGKLMIEERNFG